MGIESSRPLHDWYRRRLMEVRAGEDAASSPVAELERLWRLRQEGALDAREFAAAKAAALRRLEPPEAFSAAEADFDDLVPYDAEKEPLSPASLSARMVS